MYLHSLYGLRMAWCTLFPFYALPGVMDGFDVWPRFFISHNQCK